MKKKRRHAALCIGCYDYAFLRFSTPKPRRTEPSNQTVAGAGTEDTEPPESPLKTETPAAPVGKQSEFLHTPSPSVPPAV